MAPPWFTKASWLWLEVIRSNLLLQQ